MSLSIEKSTQVLEKWIKFPQPFIFHILIEFYFGNSNLSLLRLISCKYHVKNDFEFLMQIIEKTWFVFPFPKLLKKFVVNPQFCHLGTCYLLLVFPYPIFSHWTFRIYFWALIVSSLVVHYYSFYHCFWTSFGDIFGKIMWILSVIFQCLLDLV